MLNTKPKEELTLWEIYLQYKNELERNWNDDTKKLYKTNFYKILRPRFAHKPYAEFSSKEIIDILKEIKIDGYIKEGQKQIYSDPKMASFRANIRSIDRIAVDNGIRSVSAFWGSTLGLKKYNIWNNNPVSDDANDEEEVANTIRENILLRKSLNPEEEKKVYDILMHNYKQSGELMGIALMYSLGLRNEEACGVKFGDIIPIVGYENCYMLRIYTAITSDRKETIDLKTNNAYRYIPIPEALITLLNARKEFIQEQLNLSDSEIKKLTITCKNNFLDKRCNTRDLTEAGKMVLHKANVDGRELAYIELNKGEMDLVISEKEPTAYLLRRNFGTMMRFVDLTQNEIEYIIGHSITSSEKTRNYITNPDLLYSIKKKMDNRPYFSSEYPVNEKIILNSGQSIQIDTPYKQSFTIPQHDKNSRILLNLQAKNPNDKISIEFKTDSEIPLDVEIYSTVVKQNKSNDLSVLNLIHKEYGKINNPEANL